MASEPQVKINFITVLSALSAAMGSALAGWVLLPIDDVYKSIGAFVLTVSGTFIAGLLKPPTGTQVASNPTPSKGGN